MENKQTNKQTDFGYRGDTISRREAIDALVKRWGWIKNFDRIGEDIAEECKTIINSLPSAQPDLDSAYTEGYTAAESKYRKMWDEMQATKQDAVEDTWDLFEMISSAWYGKQCYFKQNDGSVYSRLSCRYMTFDDAVREFMEKIDND